MTKIAVDVALLLPEKINKICIGINKHKNADAFFRLNEKDSFPHITLAMGVIDERDLPKAEERLSKIAEKFSSLDLEIEIIDFTIMPQPENKKSYQFTLKLTQELKALHAMIMKELLPLFSYDVKLYMFYKDDETLHEVSMFWVKNYAKNHQTSEDFKAHISLKCRSAQFNKFPIKFSASKLALCHLGDYCTCRKILFSTNIKKREDDDRILQEMQKKKMKELWDNKNDEAWENV